MFRRPIMHGYGRSEIGIGKPTQIIQPWQFGHPETKATCLWLKNLPPLTPTALVWDEMMGLPLVMRHRIHRMPPGPNRWKERSKTFQGIADAMADQWSAYVVDEKIKAAKR